MKEYSGLEIAIIGMAGKFPGAADVQAFWNNLANGVESISFFTDEELISEGVDKNLINDPRYVKANGLLEDKDCFDAAFFNYRPDEVRLMDPQVRIFHECVWTALEDAGCNPDDEKNKIGLFAGATSNINWELYAQLMNRNGYVDNFSVSLLANAKFVTTKIAYNLNLRGPAIYLDTACSTSLVAVHQACKSLLLGECNIAVAGGVTITARSRTGYLYQEGLIHSRDGHCRTFDNAASGTVGSEGAGVVVLKSLKNALKDGDHIWAVIKGSGINNDGNNKVGFTAPSIHGQMEAILMAQKWAKSQPESISYIEAHGTATKLGDPVEVEALAQVFGKSTEKYCALGSVKSNLGHLDAAAGIAGLIKTVLALKHRQIPPSLHFQILNREINFNNTPFYINTELKEWQNDKYPLRAGVSSFGIGGTNAHVILEEAPQQAATTASRHDHLLMLSAKTPAALERATENFCNYLHNSTDADLPDIAWTLQTGRKHFPYRKYVVCSNSSEAIDQLISAKAIKNDEPVTGKLNSTKVFMFSGQGSQYMNMCYDLYTQEPVFKEEVDRCIGIIRQRSGKDLLPVLFNMEAGDPHQINNTEYTQPLLFVIEYSLARLLMKWGIMPDMMIGHSIGEYVAACISGVFSLEDALWLVVKRGELMQSATAGIMLSVSVVPDTIKRLLADFPSISLAAVNSSSLCVVSGPEEAIHVFKKMLDKEGYENRILRTSHAFHSGMMDGILQPFHEAVKKVRIHPIQIPFISNLTGDRATDAELSRPEYWADHLRHTVLFSDGIQKILKNEGVLFIEVGPGKSLCAMVRSNIMRKKTHQVCQLVRNAGDDISDLHCLLSGLGQLWLQGTEPAWNIIYQNETRRKISLPGYSFEKSRYPVCVNAFTMLTDSMAEDHLKKKPDMSDWFYVPSWKMIPHMPGTRTNRLEGRTLLLADNGAISQSLVSAYKKNDQQIVSVQSGGSYCKKSEEVYEIRPGVKEDFSRLFAELQQEDRLPDRIIHAWGISTSTENNFSVEALHLYFLSLVEAVQALQQYGGMLGKQFVLLTSGVHQVLNEHPEPGMQSLTPALLTVMSQEFQNVRTCHIDISLSESANDLYKEIQVAEPGTVTCLRHGRRWQQVFEKVKPGDNGSAEHFRQGGVYMITGGLGRLGCCIAAYLITKYNARVAILGRTTIPAPQDWDNELYGDASVKEKIKMLQQLKDGNGEVLYMQSNVADVTALTKAVQQCEKTFGNLHGVIHAAGVLAGNSLNPITALTKEDFIAQFEPKIQGLQALKAVVGSKELDFCLVVSSLSAVLGGLGFGAYAPANAFLDQYIQAHKANGELKNWISVNFDGFEFEKENTDAITRHEMIGVLDRVLSLREWPRLIVSTSDLYKRLDKWVFSIHQPKEDDSLPGNLFSNDTTQSENTVSGYSADTVVTTLFTLWQHFFGRPDITADDDFFDIGGDSLKAMTMVGRIHKTLNVEVPVKAFFSHSTVNRLAEFINRLNAEKNNRDKDRKYQAIPKSPVQDWYPMSSAQKRLYFLYEFDKLSLAYNLPQAIKLKGPVDKEKFHQIINAIAGRHEILRTYVDVVNEIPVQRITAQVDIPLEYYYATAREVPQLVQEFIRPFDLNKGPLIRTGLIKVAKEEYVFMVDLHHFISDGVSFSIFLNEFMTLYKGDEPDEVPLQYRDYALWQTNEIYQQAVVRERDWWLQEFREEVMSLELPLDHNRPLVRSYEGATVHFLLKEEELETLRKIADAEGVTLFMVLLSVYSILLGKLSGQEDVVIGTPTSGRNHADLEHILGMFVNTVAIRTNPNGTLSYRDFLKQLKSKMLAVFDQQAYPYELLIEELKLARDTSRNPLFDVWFVYQNRESAKLELPDLEISHYNTGTNISQFDLSLTAGELNGNMQLNFEYSTELFKQETIERFIAYFRTIISAIGNDMDCSLASIALVQGAEKELLLQGFNDTAKPVDREKAFFQLFATQTACTPQRIAVVHNSTAVSYRELYQQACKVASHLAMQGIGNGGRIAIYMPRGVEMLTAILGILAVGAAYVPIETEYPLKRVTEILVDSEAPIVLVNNEMLTAGEQLKRSVNSIKEVSSIDNLLQCDYPEADWQNKAGVQDVAYIIYTSGTTGRPKGAMVHHLGMLNHMYGMMNAMQLDEKDVIAQTASCSFDISVWQLLCALLSGGTTCIIDKEKMLDGGALLKEIHEKQVTIAEMVPSLLRSLLDEAIASGPAALLSLRWMIPTAELISTALVKKWYSVYPQIPLINAYGPAEASDDVTLYIIENNIEKQIIPIGKPIGNIRIYVLDKYLNLCPVGVIGEIGIAGLGVGKGYWNDAEKTARSFVPNPFVEPGSAGEADYGVLYRTGDTGYFQWDGNIIFTGRRDHQVKIRGHRIELGDIESHLLQHGQIKEVVVLAREKDGSKYLVAYYVADEEIESEKLRGFIAGNLPDYMVPAFYVWLQQMPLTVNNKLDRNALPEPHVNRQEQSTVLPATPQEQLLVNIWSRVLEVDQVGTTDNFFSAGGDSIKSTQIISRLRSAGYEVSVKDIFIYQTIRELAGKLRRTNTLKDQSPVIGTAALTPVQQLFFRGPVQNKYHYNQSVMLNFPAGIQLDLVKRIFTKIQKHHDALRMVFVKQDDGVVSMENRPVEMELGLREYNLREAPDAASMLTTICNELQAGIDLQSGPLMKLGIFHMKDGSRLLIVIHHLVVDGVSWRILFEDIETLYNQVINREALTLPPKTDAFLSWPAQLAGYTKSNSYKKAAQYWQQQSTKKISPIPRDREEGEGISKYNGVTTVRLSRDITTQLLTRSHMRLGVRINDLLLTALALAVQKQYGVTAMQIDLEGHGREDIGAGIDISRTVGWFTSIYPVMLKFNGNSLTAAIKEVKETLRKIPNNGIDYGIWKCTDKPDYEQGNDQPSRIIFNYLGQFDADTKDHEYTIAPEAPGNEIYQEELNEYDWEISGLVGKGQLEINLRYSQRQYDKETIDALMNAYKESLEDVIACCCTDGKKEYTPSDLTCKELPADKLDELQARFELEDVYPLSPMQEGMLFHALYDVQGVQYFEQLICRISGTLDLHAVEQTMNDIIARYTVLRTAFVHDIYDYPLQVVLQARKIDFLYKDVRSECEAQATADIISRQREQDRSRRFNLEKDVLMRLTVLQLAGNEYAFIWSYHHVLMDGWCMGIIFNDFMELYQAHCSGKPVVLPAVQPYARYIDWLQNRSREESAVYWQQYLSGYEQLATMTQPGEVTQVAVDELVIEPLVISRSQTDKLRNLSVKYGVTINTILQTAWGILLSKYNNTNDVIFGSVVSGRPSEIEGIEEMIGLFINTVPVRVTWSREDSVTDLLRKMQDASLNAEPHHYHPLSEIQSLSALGRHLLDHILVFENYPLDSTIKNAADSNIAIAVTDVEVMVQTNYDLAIVIVPGEEIRMNFKYNARIYNKSYVQRMAVHFEHIVQQVSDESNCTIAKVEIVTEAEKGQLLRLHGPVTDLPQKTFIQLFEEQVAQVPDQYAVISGSETMTYADLHEKSRSLAAAINDIPGVGEIVALYAEPSVEMLIGIAGILKSGRAFLPLDPGMHKERQEKCLQESKVSLLLTQASFQNDLRFEGMRLVIDTHSLKQLTNYTEPTIIPESLAYIMYTSGSTGQPKGVKIKNSNLVNYILWFKNMLALEKGNHSILTSSYAFDLGYSSVFPILASGGTLHLIPSSLYHAPEDLLQYISDYPVTYLKLTPTLFKAIVGAPSFGSYPLPNLKYILLGGEKLVPADIDIAKKAYNHWQFINHYGPTETTIGVIAQKIENWNQYKHRPAIGKPISNTQVFILDKNRQLMPAGLSGELCIGGDSVGAGYLDRDNLTNEKFIAYPLAKNEKIYRTGDMARWLPDGTIEFLNRIDNQVKIRGYRIELGEIENRLTAHPSIRDAVVITRERDGYVYLIAYYVAEKECDAAFLRDFLLSRLPDYMVPAYYVHLRQLPLTPNGKLNRKALPDLQITSQNWYFPARTTTEALLVNIWADLLHMEKEQISIYDDFFALGAHSIIAIRLSYAIQRQCQVKLSMRQIFEQPTIEQLAGLIARATRRPENRIQKVEQREYYPASSAQERLFYEHSLHPDIPVYNNCKVYKIEGELNIVKLTGAFQLLIARHESLRTGFLMTTEGIVQVIRTAPAFELVDLNNKNYRTVQEAFNDFVQPFNLMGNSFIRAGLLQHEKEGNLLFLDIHHIICDGISRNILMNDFKRLYNGNHIEPLTITYADFACWQRSLNETLNEQREFWLRKLAGRSIRPDLPMVSGSEGEEVIYAACNMLPIGGKLYAGIKELIQNVEVSPFMFFLSVYYLLLSKVSGCMDIVIGTESTGRTSENLQHVVGTFVNILPLRMQIRSGISFREFLQEVKEQVLEAYENQDYQYNEILAALHEQEGSNGNLVDAHFSFVNTVHSTVELEELQFTSYDGLWTETTDYSLSVQVAEEKDGFYIYIIYSKNLFTDDTIELLMDYFRSIVSGIVKDSQSTIDAIEIKDVAV